MMCARVETKDVAVHGEQWFGAGLRVQRRVELLDSTGRVHDSLLVPLEDYSLDQVGRGFNSSARKSAVFSGVASNSGSPDGGGGVVSGRGGGSSSRRRGKGRGHGRGGSSGGREGCLADVRILPWLR